MHVSDELHPIQVESYGRMTPTQKHRAFLRMLNGGLDLKRRALKQQHPTWTEREVRQELARLVRDGRT